MGELINFNGKRRMSFEMKGQVQKLSNNDVIERIAEIMHKLIFRNNTDYENLPTYLNEYGVDVSYANLDNVDGFLQVEKGSSKPIIVIKAPQYKPRQRFTMAHELGHLMLHLKWDPYEDFKVDGVVEVTMYRGNDDTPIADTQKEIDANKFAAAFLMPKSKVSKCLETVTSRSEAERIVSDAFAVSMPAARLRIKELRGVLSI